MDLLSNVLLCGRKRQFYAQAALEAVFIILSIFFKNARVCKCNRGRRAEKESIIYENPCKCSTKMDFARMIQQTQKQLSAMPRKLPNSQIVTELKHANTIRALNKLLFFCAYQEPDNYTPSEAMCLVMLDRLVVLIGRLPQKSAADWHQMRANVGYIQGTLLQQGKKKKRVSSVWKLLFVVQVISAHTNNHESGAKLMHEPYVHGGIRSAFNAHRGRHFLATSRINAGEIVLVDPSPLAMIAFHAGEGKSFDSLCCHCGEPRVVCPFPCPNCPDVSFCSLPCLRAAMDSHHKYECPMGLFDLLKAINAGSVGKLLMLRIATLYGLVERPAECEKQPEYQRVDAFECAYDQLLSLTPAPAQLLHAEEERGVFVTALIDMLQWRSASAHELMSLWGRIIDANSFAIEVPLGRYVEKTVHVATALFGPASYVNHACAPNMAFAFDKGAKVITMRAIRDIPKGEELTISYGGPGFLGRPTPWRQSYVSANAELA